MTAPKEISKLVDMFERNFNAYKSPSYKEDQLRQEFINPFFKALGWDVDNRRGAAPQYRDVIYEDSIKIAGGTKAPDYCFTMRGGRKFFVEAKKPNIDIRKDTNAQLQLKVYAWNKKLPVAILTNFEQFDVYEARKPPKKSDKTMSGRILNFTYNQYEDRWDEIESIFSEQAVFQGLFDQFAESKMKKRGTIEVDTEFLKEMEGWRRILARNIALRNQKLTVHELNYSVQATIDRIIFLRMCEGRGIEPYGQLQSLLRFDNIYRELSKIYRKADEKYNSGLFHFKKEKDRSTPLDELTLTLSIDDKILKDIIKRLYFPDSPYEFSVISPEILGNVYEQFLGKVIRLTPSHQARVDDKPEVKKAGGVYYTPQYIVDYIVENTVGKLNKGKTPRQISKLRILDPACGSGSFLLRAYTYLLNFHLDYYSNLKNPKRYKDKIYQGKRDEWYLTINEKKRILLNNIYGVDIDSQAVEVTKLSLLLKVLEGERQDVLERQQKLWQERALPDLGNNIKCGNSLIDSDFYEGGIQTKLQDENEMSRINVFNWDNQFKDIMNSGKFDAVIGNPPYLRIQGLQEFYGNQIPYFIRNYKSAVKRFDLYLLFAEKGLKLLSENGYLGFICPHKFLNSDFGSGLREFLLDNNALDSFVSFGNNLVFKKSTTYTGILLLKKDRKRTFYYFEFSNMRIHELPKQLSALKKKDFTKYNLKDFSKEPWVFVNKENQNVFERLSKQPNTLGELFDEILVGVQSGIDNIHVLKFINKPKKGIIKLFSERAKINIDIEEGLVKPFLRGEDVHRYSAPKYSYFCIYPYQIVNGKTKIIEESEIKKKYPLGYDYLRKYRAELKEIRKRQKTNQKYWYSCHRSRDMTVFKKRRIITPEISYKGNMTICEAGKYNNTQVYSLVPSDDRKEKLEYWLGILNSNLLWWYITNTGTVLRGGYFRFKTNYLKPFPIRTIDFTDKTDVARHNKMTNFVKQMFELNKRIIKAKTPIEKERIHRQIDAIDRQINKLVYELYGLTKKEIDVVERTQ